MLTKHADVLAVVKDPTRFPSLTHAGRRLADEGVTPEEAFASHHNLMKAAMVSLRPTQELYIRHRRELDRPVGRRRGRCATGR